MDWNKIIEPYSMMYPDFSIKDIKDSYSYLYNHEIDGGAIPQLLSKIASRYIEIQRESLKTRMLEVLGHSQFDYTKYDIVEITRIASSILNFFKCPTDHFIFDGAIEGKDLRVEGLCFYTRLWEGNSYQGYSVVKFYVNDGGELSLTISVEGEGYEEEDFEDKRGKEMKAESLLSRMFKVEKPC